MDNDVLIDNWLLQDLGILYQEGLSTKIVQGISFSEDRFDYTNRESFLMNLDVLFSFLVDVVTRDRLVIDQAWAETWKGRSAELDGLAKSGIINQINIDITKSQPYRDTTHAALEKMCYCSMVQEQQKRNEKWFEEHGESENQFFGQLFWGTAGNLGRSNHLHLPYNPHPLRSEVLDQLNYGFWIPDAKKRVHTWINSKRNELFSGQMNSDFTIRNPQVLLDPVIIEIIEASKYSSDLIPVALQLRDAYQPYRKLLKQYQKALCTEDAVDQLHFNRYLQEADNWLLKRKSDDKYGRLRISIPLWVFGFSKNLGFEQLAYRYGARAVLKKMIFQPAGFQSLKKLMRMFDADSKSIHTAIEHFRMQSDKVST